jgi:hypothetical protein
VAAVAVVLAAGTPAHAADQRLRGASSRAAAGAAATCTPAGLNPARGTLARQLSYREVRLRALQRKVSRAAFLTAPDRATLSSDLAAQRSGIAALAAKVPSDGTCADVVADAKAMVDHYRVYVVMAPQVHLTVAADSETAVASELESYEPHLSATIARDKQAGKDVTGLEQALADFKVQVATGRQAATGIAPSVLAFTPASYPGSWGTFKADQQQLENGAAALRRAAADLHTITGLPAPRTATGTTPTT